MKKTLHTLLTGVLVLCGTAAHADALSAAASSSPGIGFYASKGLGKRTAHPTGFTLGLKMERIAALPSSSSHFVRPVASVNFPLLRLGAGEPFASLGFGSGSVRPGVAGAAIGAAAALVYYHRHHNDNDGEYSVPSL